MPLLESLAEHQENRNTYRLLGIAHTMMQNFYDGEGRLRGLRPARAGQRRSPPLPGRRSRSHCETAATPERSLERALELRPDYLEALAALANLGVSEGRVGRAVDVVARQLERIEPTARNTTSSSHSSTRGRTSRRSRRHPIAGPSSSSRARSTPTADSPGLYAREEEYPAAIDVLERALHVTPDESALLILKGVLQQQSGDAASAKATYARVLELDPGSAEAANNLAWLLAQEGSLDEALRWAQKAHEERPESHEVADTLGWILHRRRR